MSFYVYRMQLKIQEQQYDVAVLYKYFNGDYDRQLDETIDVLTKRRLPPDRILIVCQKGLQNKISEEYENISFATKARLRAVTNVTLVAYNIEGKVQPEDIFELYAPVQNWILTDADLQYINEAGMRNVIETTGTRMTAPLGYVFRKPSGNASEVFIRAGNMMKDPSALAVVFHAMIRVIPIRAKRLYIDSFTILSVALTYQRCIHELAIACGVEPVIPTITNFHSYSMDSNLRFELTNDYIILISASSSGGLALRLVNECGAQADRIFHLLVFSEELNFRYKSVYFQQEPMPAKSIHSSFQKVITIPGEEFIASHGDTRTVDIKKAHLVDTECKIYKDQFYQRSLVLNLQASGSYASAFRPVGLCATDKIGSEEFEAWVSRLAHIDLPASATIAIASDDGTSRLLAFRLASLISATKKDPVHVITESQLIDEKDDSLVSKDGSVLIVCSDETDGESLLAISQSLRDKPHLHRHYIIGHLFPSSAQQFRRLRNNLRVNGKGTPYGWSVYCVTPLGHDSLTQSWLLERNFNYETVTFSSGNRALANALKTRAINLQKPSLTRDELFLPKLNGKKLTLRPESVLFERNYRNIAQVTVYVQIAAALQRARDRHLCDDKTILPEELCFANNPFIDTVIDPDTFSRFNDGVIQAAILRSALASELNYSRDRKLSSHMLNIISQIIKSRNRDGGEAVLEFILAVSLNKLRLHKDDNSMLVRLIEDEPVLNSLMQIFTLNPAF